MGKEAIKDISRAFSGGNRHLLLLPVVLLNLLPSLLDSLSDPGEFSELALFTCAASSSSPCQDRPMRSNLRCQN